MSLLVVGSLAYDEVETPSGKRSDQLGGAAVFFALAATRFTPVSVVGVVGDDFRSADRELLERHGVDVSGIEQRSGSTFRWSGHYMDDLNTAVTLDTQLNVFEGFAPKLSTAHANSKFLFLANIHPATQISTLKAMSGRPQCVACDSMNLWINTERDQLSELVGMVDALIINDGEAKLYTGQSNLRGMADALLEEGLKYVLIKRGEYGVALFTPEFSFALPALPLREVRDPTGAGDSFAGGFMGYLASVDSFTEEHLRRAVVSGSVTASMAVSQFGTEGLTGLDAERIEARFREFDRLTNYIYLGAGEHLPLRKP